MSGRQKDKRIVSFELLRILAMFMVIVLHFNTQSGALLVQGKAVNAAGIMADLLESFCIVAVNVYVLISGYFLSEATYKISRLVALECQILFYTLLIPAGLIVLGIPLYGDQGLWQKAAYIFPVSMQHYWFATAYVLLYLLVPVLNVAVQKLTRRQLKFLILALLFFSCFLKSISPVELVIDRYGYDLFWFLCLYLIAAYMRRYGTPRFDHPVKAALTYVCSCALIFAIHMALHMVHLRSGKLEYFAGVPFHYNAILTLTASIGLFTLFQFVHIKEGFWANVIRAIAPFTFGVYLIHEHVDIRDRWIQVLAQVVGETAMDNAAVYLLQAVVSAALMFVICMAIDWVRSEVFAFCGRFLEQTKLADLVRKLDQLFYSDQDKR